MKSTALLLAATVALLAPPVLAQPGPPRDVTVAPQAGTIDIVTAMAAVTARFDGQIVAAELVMGRPDEATTQVYEFRLLTPMGDILRVRVDAVDGAILDVEGRGLVDARRPGAGA